MTYERRIASGILAETIKQFKGCTIQSTIRNSAHSYSDEKVDAISDYEERVDAIRNSEELLDAVSDPKKRSKQKSKGSYSHYQRKMFTKIIEEPVRPKDHPRRNPSD